MPDQKNLILAIALSIAIVLGFEFLYNLPRQERERALQAERAAREAPAQVQQPGAVPPGAPAVRVSRRTGRTRRTGRRRHPQPRRGDRRPAARAHRIRRASRARSCCAARGSTTCC